jgi:predicted ATPase
VNLFRHEVARKTGSPAKPATTGFRAYAVNRCSIERHASVILNALKTALPVEEQHIGSLGENKGELSVRTEFRFQDGSKAAKSLMPLAKVKKGTQQAFASVLRQVVRAAYQDNLFERISQLNEIEDVATIRSLRELLLFRRYFVLEGREYIPSSGEASMVMLEKELRRDADIYILDEPERSLGNEYISEVIVPLIKAHARAGKKVFISTHDANIAVRTLPYCSMYRTHSATGYSTYIGNPFSNDLVNVDDPANRLDWRLISMKTLEGGKAAFGERGRIYGNA